MIGMDVRATVCSHCDMLECTTFPLESALHTPVPMSSAVKTFNAEVWFAAVRSTRSGVPRGGMRDGEVDGIGSFEGVVVPTVGLAIREFGAIIKW